jgi:protein-S-isoprenylcysteine O-methyltransferase Ste14
MTSTPKASGLAVAVAARSRARAVLAASRGDDPEGDPLRAQPERVASPRGGEGAEEATSVSSGVGGRDRPPRSDTGRAIKLRTLLASFAWFVGLAVLLFAPAGTLAWPAAWVFLGLMLAGSVVFYVVLLRHDRALLAERLAGPIQRGQKRWDKVWMATFVFLFYAWLALMGLDTVRFGWSHVPLWLHILGAGGILAYFWISYIIFRENPFVAPVVKLQTDRGQRVISTGPYAHVRHPMYAGAVLYLAGTALLLGSWYGLAATVIFIPGGALRAVL